MRINFPSKDVVHMHDTPSKGLFGEAMRFPHPAACACSYVRDALVNWLLAETAGWSLGPGDRWGSRRRAQGDAKVARRCRSLGYTVTAWATLTASTTVREDHSTIATALAGGWRTTGAR